MNQPALAHTDGPNHPASLIAGFEIDADLGYGDADHPEHALGGDDWDDVILASSNGFTCPANSPSTGPWAGGPGILICDKHSQSGEFDDNIFTVGGKDFDEGTWTIQPGNIPKKDDISNVYFLQKIVGGQFYVLMGQERLDVNGESHVDFELNKWARTINTDGSVIQVRQDGDLLITLDVENGGVNPQFASLDGTAPRRTPMNRRPRTPTPMTAPATRGTPARRLPAAGTSYSPPTAPATPTRASP